MYNYFQNANWSVLKAIDKRFVFLNYFVLLGHVRNIFLCVPVSAHIIFIEPFPQLPLRNEGDKQRIELVYAFQEFPAWLKKLNHKKQIEG